MENAERVGLSKVRFNRAGNNTRDTWQDKV